MFNIYAILIITMMLTKFALDLTANLLNLRTLKRNLPDEFSGVFNVESYKKSQDYTRTNTKFQMIELTFGFALILVFWFGGGFGTLDSYIRSWNFPEIWTGLLYIGILTLGNALIFLPFSIYHTFVIEERFGFNRTTPKTFILDLLKMLALGILLGGALLASVLYLFQYGGGLAWIYAWLAVALFSLIVSFLGPRLLMPIFLKFTPLEEGELKKSIMDLAEKLNFPVSGIYVIDGSRRSSKTNAFFTGFGKHKRIALFDTLIAKQTIPELVSVLAHEIGHYKKRHMITGLVLGILQTGLMLFLFSYFLLITEFFTAFGLNQPSVYAGLIIFFLAYSFLGRIESVLMNILSRKHEYEADVYAAKNTKNPEIMISALKKLSLDNLSNLEPHPFYVFLNYSHPPVLERIRTLRKMI
ncbi:MAG: peptidase M48 [Candidatus Sungbacteria bacterium RIFCSPLOWO2_12_FULL_41_11]|uniref:Peptidase M48 n=1 Tax=Candidatus Sungbacteria bacterium RIFCSPLOWO2_12_FULL_41_11 TaxID=1802286 RepID=A0A1G2LSV6_9BACT|nr:MAG: Ste24 endopeptidase [Parcubacteria group bacterium GW2011_GWA2_42_14]OGZ97492.1 MAG: peptidase M48 [Candidatus Sungbacteria bacterium RIFCSPHIGHO2_02_FULL_41_12b]OHA14594.1 MAG: peptidase M48 [Candidatus Sungbacteria bacterium RIFCSPLOWO2_12_FULL_41_11]